MVEFLARCGRTTLNHLAEAGRAGTLLMRVIFGGYRLRRDWSLLVKQLYMVGVLSVAIIVVSGLFIGMVLALQGYNVLVDYGAEESLGPLVALSL
nr:ABC transporter permease [Corallincola sp.]